MSAYISFTETQREQARQTDLAAFLRSRGETLKRSGSEFSWKDGSQTVTIRGNLWFHQYQQVGGDAVDFVQKFYGLTYPEAVSMLLGRSLPTVIPKKSGRDQAGQGLVLPPRNRQIRRAFAYLCSRGIDREILSVFIRRGMIYESSDYHSVVFLGHDPEGHPRHAHKRGTNRGSTYKGNAVGSDPRYSFHWTGSVGTLFLFEAPIDLLSYITMHRDGWQEHSYAAACGVSDQVLWQMLADDPGIDTVCLCRDNDAPGQKANERTAEELKERNIRCEILVPGKKDWNEDLLCQSAYPNFTGTMTDKGTIPGRGNGERQQTPRCELSAATRRREEETPCMALKL